ncbi:MAG: ATP-dependent helicase HrpB [Nitrospira sp.]
MSRLPIEEILPEIHRVLATGPNALLSAPPGSGKTTRVPLALLDAAWLSGKNLLMLEPRRLAARAAARRMAEQRQERVGETVGYRMRLDTKVGPTTRLEVVTEGVLTRLLQQDPSLEAYGIVIFDEFHERSLQADLGLTLCRETQRLFRPDLRLLVMSATLECGPVSTLLNHAPLITCHGHMFPVETRYLDQPITGRLDVAITQTIRQSLAKDHGSLLVFLPGMAEIRRVERMLLDAKLGPSVLIAPLHGDLSLEKQDAAIRPADPGTRKVVLATSIAETSLTIEGVRVVIDSGKLRQPRFDPRSGLTRLDTIRVTQDSAEQRRGRAGRLEPGLCYRLWTEREQATLTAHRSPEILEADLAPLLLDLAQWGTQNPMDLSWLTPPPAAAIAQASDLLIRLAAFTPDGHLTDHGRTMSELPLHPRLAHMLLKAVPHGLAVQACRLAALLSERDILRRSDEQYSVDLRLRLDALLGDYESTSGLPVDRAAVQRLKQTAELWRRQLAGLLGRLQQIDDRDLSQTTGLLLALAYPDRIAKRQPGDEPRYLLTNGRGARFLRPDPLSNEPFLVIADLDGAMQWAGIHLAAPITAQDIELLYSDQIVEEQSVTWDERLGAVRASRRQQLGSVVLAEEGLSRPDPDLCTAALIQGIRQAGLHILSFSPELLQWRARVAWLKHLEEPDSNWPDVSDEALDNNLETWLGPYLTGLTTLDRVTRLDLSTPLHALLSYEQQRLLDRLAPTHITVPSGSRLRIEYDRSDLPILAVRLQEMFGCQETPRVAGGKVPVMLHLLSPAKRLVQVTQDLGGFWKRSYQEVRKELRGRYPKHHWPEDPLSAPPTAKAKRPGSHRPT